MKKNYWKNRFDQIEQSANNQSVEYYHELERKYRKAMQAIEAKISAWYGRFAINNNITAAEARRLLNSDELEEMKWDVMEYIKHGEENKLTQEWLKKLENASSKFHINRLEALKLHCQQQIEVLTGGMTDDVDEFIRSVYSDTYYRSCFEIQKGVGVGFDITKLNENKLAMLVSKPWSVDGENFSVKIWKNKTKLINVLDQELSRMVMTGEAPQKVIKNIQRAMQTSKSNATRLVMTEQAYFTTLAQKDCYKELDVEQFEVVATLDGKTCPECGSYDGKHYPLKLMEAGVNSPPFHPHCRCTTCPYFDDMEGYRASRNENGKTVYEVPANMTYKEWKEKFVTVENNNQIPHNMFVGYTKEQQRELQELLSNSPLEIQNLFNKYSSKLSPIDENTPKGTAYFDPADGKVHMKRSETVAGNNHSKPYQTHYHEYAHNIDYISANGNNFSSQIYRDANGKSFGEIINDDWDRAMRDYFKDNYYSKYFDYMTAEENGGMPPKTYVKQLINNWRKNNGLDRHDPIYRELFDEYLSLSHDISDYKKFYKKHIEKLSDFEYDDGIMMSNLISDFSKNIKLNYSLRARGDLSDMFENYSVRHGGSDYPFGVGHGKNYALGNGNLEVEAFAEMIDSIVTSPESLALIKKYLPNAYKAFLDIVRGL